MDASHRRKATLGQQRSADRHRAIAQAALEVIEHGGYEAVSHRSVAEAAGVPRSATTYYFADKDDIVRSAMELLVERETGRLAAIAEAVSGDSPMDVADAIDALVETQADLLAHERLAQITQFESVLRAARRRTPAAEDAWTAGYLHVARGVLARLGSEDPETDAQLLVATINGLMIEGLTAGPPDFADSVLRPVIKRLVHLLVATYPDDRPSEP